MTMTTPRGPESTVLRMVGNAMHIQNIEVETGWTPDEIKAVARRHGYALDAASRRFRRAPQPKPAPVGIVRTSQTSTGAGVSGGIEPPSGERRDGLALVEQGPAAAPVLPETSGEVVTSTSGERASHPRSTTVGSGDTSPEPDPTVVAAIAFVRAFAELLALIDERPEAPQSTAKRPGNYPTGPRITHGATQSQIRDWARSRGLDVNPRGTVRRDIAEAYAAAHPQETP